MQPVIHHPWTLTEQEAISLQKQLALQVKTEDQVKEVQHIAGVDVAYHVAEDVLVAGIVVLDAASLQVVESVVVSDSVAFPYIPGLFSFRELPPLMKAFEKLQTVPQLIVCDGQGIAHPRRFGLASHIGLLYDIPAIGCGKTRLLGEYAQPDSHRGACSPLLDEGEIVGAVLRTQADTKPVFVSVGHGISLPTACEWITRLAPKYRLPETTRQVDQLVNKALAGLGN